MSSTPTHRRSNSLEEQISSGRSKLRKTPQSDGSRRSSFSEGERADEVMGDAPPPVAPEAVAAAAARRAAAERALEEAAARAADAAAAQELASRTEVTLDRTLSAETAEPAAPVTPPAAGDGDDASDGEGYASDRASHSTVEPDAVAGRIARRDAARAAAARLRAEQDAQAELEAQVAADREAAAREVAARQKPDAPAPPPAPASTEAPQRKRNRGALAARWTEAVRERESEAAARADRFKEEAVSSDTPVGEIFRPQQAVRTK